MTWLAPWALGAGALGMLGVIAAHLLARQRPRAMALATARFLPAGMLEATTVQPKPTDLWWLLLRLLIVALFAAGVAQPVPSPRRVPTRQVLLLDRTLPAAAQRAAVQSLGANDAVIAYDSVATLRSVRDSSPAVAERAALSGALALLVRARDSLARGADALQVTVASRFAASSLDPATESLRVLVPEAITVRASAGSVPVRVERGTVTVRATGDDPVAATVTLLGDSVAARGTVLVRTPVLGAIDSSSARAGATVVHWPVSAARSDEGLHGLSVGRVTWVAAIAPDSARTVPASERAIGWWANGAPGVWREPVGTGCIVHVRAAVPTAGDQTLSLSAQRFVAALLTACDAESGRAQLPAWLAPAPRARTSTIAPVTRASVIAPWLVGAAIVLLLIEFALRAARPA